MNRNAGMLVLEDHAGNLPAHRLETFVEVADVFACGFEVRMLPTSLSDLDLHPVQAGQINA